MGRSCGLRTSKSREAGHFLLITRRFPLAEAEQVDFGAGPVLMHESGALLKTWFFVMTLCRSRHQYAELVLDQTVETWLACHRRAFDWFGGRVERVIKRRKQLVERTVMHRFLIVEDGSLRRSQPHRHDARYALSTRT